MGTLEELLQYTLQDDSQQADGDGDMISKRRPSMSLQIMGCHPGIENKYVNVHLLTYANIT